MSLGKGMNGNKVTYLKLKTIIILSKKKRNNMFLRSFYSVHKSHLNGQNCFHYRQTYRAKKNRCRAEETTVTQQWLPSLGQQCKVLQVGRNKSCCSSWLEPQMFVSASSEATVNRIVRHFHRGNYVSYWASYTHLNQL